MNNEQSLPEEEEKDYEIVEELSEPARPEDGQPRRRKKKKSRPLPDEKSDDRPADDPLARIFTLGLLAFGIIMSLAAAGGLGGKDFALRAVGEMIVYLIVLLPLSVAALMAAGSYMGVNYGELKPAILKLSAIAYFNNGMMWVNAWAGAPSYMGIMLCSFICFGLFFMIYDFDVSEAWISVIALNAVQFTAHIFIMFAIASAENHAKKKDPKPPADESCIHRMIEV